jgi:hypothetical protein
MHIMRTNAVDVSIHAVSPELILSAATMNGAVGAAAAGAAAAAVGAVATSSAQVVDTPQATTQKNTNRNKILISANPLFPS